ncbi:flagellar biosynthesis regulator FlaF [Pseudogemmobacter faecipullorum]|uniref:Flagellar biosynthesis regulator FlaF n=1 Tax=Pseudogemmobacter faecipullorum TaxID=2755041 RepID=A0ABS8CL45_9RHOB|nr:flagellar biosynthesis regulator FlaF [Pseudogemmobacter faecipullorum]MCB5409580.1 flagellar biosynthesis regulator FlaF [Pseudogemmobacter faecipullorum]
MSQQPLLAYNQTATPLRTPRAAEYEVIARVTSRLAQAHQQRNENRPELLAALFRNERLWSTLASDVAEPGNSLPVLLRARLFYLYRFTVEHSQRIRAGNGEAGVLIDINRAVMTGLRGQGSDR